MPPSAERGIGGTGAPPLATAERGIGGTGGPAGTGVVGVITGFGSIFVDRLEVRYTAATPVEIDGAPASTAALSTGQVVAIDAVGPPTALEAQSLAVRHEVAGPVESVTQGGTRADVAGQTVVLDSAIEGASRLRRGTWVAVSGLRQPDGSISATRIGPSPAGIVRVHGRLTAGPSGLGIGALLVPPQPGGPARAGQYVTLSGRYTAGRLVAASIAPDRLATNPLAHFGPHVARVFVESYVSAKDGLLRTPGGLRVSATPSLGAAVPTPRWSVITLEPQPGAVLARPEFGSSSAPHRRPSLRRTAPCRASIRAPPNTNTPIRRRAAQRARTSSKTCTVPGPGAANANAGLIVPLDQLYRREGIAGAVALTGFLTFPVIVYWNIAKGGGG